MKLFKEFNFFTFSPLARIFVNFFIAFSSVKRNFVDIIIIENIIIIVPNAVIYYILRCFAFDYAQVNLNNRTNFARSDDNNNYYLVI